MPVRLVNLRDVPNDEAEGICNLLTENRISYYETPAGNWGITAAAIWLHDPQQLERAKVLLETFQVQRAQVARAEYQQRRREGSLESLWDRVRQHPVRAMVYLGAVLLILYLSTAPFVSL